MDASLESEMSGNERETLSKICGLFDNLFDDLRKSEDLVNITLPELTCNPFYLTLCMDTCPLKELIMKYVGDVSDIVAIFMKTFTAFSGMNTSQNESQQDENKENDIQHKHKFASYVLVLLGDLMDSFEHVCKNFGSEGALQLVLSELQSQKLSDMVTELATTSVYNCCRLVPENRAICRGAIDTLKQLTTSSNPDIQADAFLTLSYIIEKTEADQIALNESCVKFLLTSLQEALDDEEERRGSGYSVLEIAQGIRHLAINDDNKRLIDGLDGLLLLERIILEDKSTDEERSFAARGIWQLAFIGEIKLKIQQRTSLIEGLRLLRDGATSDNLRDACSGALFVINDIDKKFHSHSVVGQVADSASRLNEGHIMISYQHRSQDIVLRVKQFLETQGYTVWMDVDKMKGDILDAMARAVQKAAVVLVCMSSKFKESQHCRTEATYAYTLKKDIVPLLLQEGYVPDDWLGALMGMKKYFAMYSVEEMTSTLADLVQELGERGKRESMVEAAEAEVQGATLTSSTSAYHQPGAADETDCAGTGRVTEDEIKSLMQPSFSLNPLPSTIRVNHVQAWDRHQVCKWLEANGLDVSVNKKLEKLTGKRLAQISNLLNKAPEYCVKSLERELDMNFWDVLSFVTALENLCE